MNHTIKSPLSQFMTALQRNWLVWQQEEEAIERTPKLPDVINVLELVEIERLVPSDQGWVGRPGHHRPEIARALVAKAVSNLPTTEALIDRLLQDLSLRRICGFQSRRDGPPCWTFSRAHAEVAAWDLPGRVHDALIQRE